MPPLNATKLTSALVRPEALWRDVRVVPETGSTNADLLAEARAGAGEGVVLAAETQTAGRGRMGRHWVSPPHAGLTFSVLLRPRSVPASAFGWLPLLAGVATATAVSAAAAVDAVLKWPNDVLVGGSKLAGILAESRGDAVVVGIGINVSQRPAELPARGATSVLLEANPPAEPAAETKAASLRDQLLVAVLGELSRWYLAWRDQASPGDADGCGLRGEYTRLCATLGREVTVSLPSGQSLTGIASGLDAAGRLEVKTGGGLVAVSAGDVTHVR